MNVRMFFIILYFYTSFIVLGVALITYIGRLGEYRLTVINEHEHAHTYYLYCYSITHEAVSLIDTAVPSTVTPQIFLWQRQ